MTKKRKVPAAPAAPVQFKTYLDQSLRDAVDRRAAAERRTLRAVVEAALLHYLETTEVDA